MAIRGNIGIDVRARNFRQDIVRQARMAQKEIPAMRMKLDPKGFTQPLGRITGDMGEFQKSLDASVARTLAFGAAVGVLMGVSRAFKAMVSSAIEVEKQLADVNVILNLSASGLRQFSKDLFDVASNTGQAFESVATAATELARQGLSAQETLKRINDAMILTRLSGMDSARAVETLTSALNGFRKAALDSTDVINRLANVDASFAVSTDDLSNALSRASSTAQAAKVSFNELLAAVTSVQQSTARGGSVIGNAFKSIFTRIQRSKVRETLEGIGISTTKVNGEFRSAIAVLKDYASVYDSLSDSQKAYTDQQIAGVFQINNLRALIIDLKSEYSIFDRALKTANGTTNEAIVRNRELNKTMAALLAETAASAKELGAALGKALAEPAIRRVLEVFNTIAETIGKALDPEKGNALVKGFFGGIADFIAGPGLVMIMAGFLKLFQFIATQTGQAAKEIFRINSGTKKQEELERKINTILSSNNQLYASIMAETGNTAKQEKILLKHLKSSTLELQKQQAMVSAMARSRGVRGGLQGIPKGRASGFVPNFAGGVEGAIASERHEISMRTGGATPSAKPAVLKNFPIGGGRKQTVVANTDEVVVPRFNGKKGSAIFNKEMIRAAGGVPAGAQPIRAAGGVVPASGRLVQISQTLKGRTGTKDNFMRGYKKGQFKLEGDTLKVKSIRDLDDVGEIYGILAANKSKIKYVDVGRLNKFSGSLLNAKRLHEIQAEVPGLTVKGKFDSIQGMNRSYFEDMKHRFRGKFNPPLDDFDWGFGTALSRGIGRNKMGFTMNLAKGLIPNLAKIGRAPLTLTTGMGRRGSAIPQFQESVRAAINKRKLPMATGQAEESIYSLLRKAQQYKLSSLSVDQTRAFVPNQFVKQAVKEYNVVNGLSGKQALKDSDVLTGTLKQVAAGKRNIVRGDIMEDALRRFSKTPEGDQYLKGQIFSTGGGSKGGASGQYAADAVAEKIALEVKSGEYTNFAVLMKNLRVPGGFPLVNNIAKEIKSSQGFKQLSPNQQREEAAIIDNLVAKHKGQVRQETEKVFEQMAGRNPEFANRLQELGYYKPGGKDGVMKLLTGGAAGGFIPNFAGLAAQRIFAQSASRRSMLEKLRTAQLEGSSPAQLNNLLAGGGLSARTVPNWLAPQNLKRKHGASDEFERWLGARSTIDDVVWAEAKSRRGRTSLLNSTGHGEFTQTQQNLGRDNLSKLITSAKDAKKVLKDYLEMKRLYKTLEGGGPKTMVGGQLTEAIVQNIAKFAQLPRKVATMLGLGKKFPSVYDREPLDIQNLQAWSSQKGMKRLFGDAGAKEFKSFAAGAGRGFGGDIAGRTPHPMEVIAGKVLRGTPKKVTINGNASGGTVNLGNGFAEILRGDKKGLITSTSFSGSGAQLPPDSQTALRNMIGNQFKTNPDKVKLENWGLTGSYKQFHYKEKFGKAYGDVVGHHREPWLQQSRNQTAHNFARGLITPRTTPSGRNDVITTGIPPPPPLSQMVDARGVHAGRTMRVGSEPKNLLKRGEGTVSTSGRRGAKALNVHYLGGGTQIGGGPIKKLGGTLAEAARSGSPITAINAGDVVGARVPSMLQRLPRLIEKLRARLRREGVAQPPVTVSGNFNPAHLKMDERGLAQQASWVQKNRDKGIDPWNQTAKWQPGEGERLNKALQNFPDKRLAQEYARNPNIDREIPFSFRAAKGFVPNFAGRAFTPGRFATKGYKKKGWERLGAGMEGTGFRTQRGGGFKTPHELNLNKANNSILQNVAKQRRAEQMRRPLVAKRFNEVLAGGPMFAPKMKWGKAMGQEGVHFEIIKGKSLPELVKSGAITQAQQGKLLDHLAAIYKPKFAAFRKEHPRMDYLPKLDRNPENFIIPDKMLAKTLPAIKSGKFSSLPKRSVSAIDILESKRRGLGHMATNAGGFVPSFARPLLKFRNPKDAGQIGFHKTDITMRSPNQKKAFTTPVPAIKPSLFKKMKNGLGKTYEYFKERWQTWLRPTQEGVAKALGMPWKKLNGLGKHAWKQDPAVKQFKDSIKNPTQRSAEGFVPNFVPPGLMIKGAFKKYQAAQVKKATPTAKEARVGARTGFSLKNLEKWRGDLGAALRKWNKEAPTNSMLPRGVLSKKLPGPNEPYVAGNPNWHVFKSSSVARHPQAFRNFMSSPAFRRIKGAESIRRQVNSQLAQGASTSGRKRELERLTLQAKSGINRTQQEQAQLAGARGFVPNYASITEGLQEAIGREETALAEQGSNAKIYVDQDNRVKTPANPMGMLVANTRDEPAGGSQGVNRALKEGIDPKIYGAAKGLVPNYVLRPISPGMRKAQLQGIERMMRQKDFMRAERAVAAYNKNNPSHQLKIRGPIGPGMSVHSAGAGPKGASLAKDSAQNRETRERANPKTTRLSGLGWSKTERSSGPTLTQKQLKFDKSGGVTKRETPARPTRGTPQSGSQSTTLKSLSAAQRAEFTTRGERMEKARVEAQRTERKREKTERVRTIANKVIGSNTLAQKLLPVKEDGSRAPVGKAKTTTATTPKKPQKGASGFATRGERADVARRSQKVTPQQIERRGREVATNNPLVRAQLKAGGKDKPMTSGTQRRTSAGPSTERAGSRGPGGTGLVSGLSAAQRQEVGTRKMAMDNRERDDKKSADKRAEKQARKFEKALNKAFGREGKFKEVGKIKKADIASRGGRGAFSAARTMGSKTAAKFKETQRYKEMSRSQKMAFGAGRGMGKMKMGNLAKGVGGKIKGLGTAMSGMGGMGLMMGGSALQQEAAQRGQVSAVGETLSGVGMGAMVGSMFGPVGALVGASVGGIYGYFKAEEKEAEMAVKATMIARKNEVAQITKQVNAMDQYAQAAANLDAALKAGNAEGATKSMEALSAAIGELSTSGTQDVGDILGSFGNQKETQEKVAAARGRLKTKQTLESQDIAFDETFHSKDAAPLKNKKLDTLVKESSVALGGLMDPDRIARNVDAINDEAAKQGAVSRNELGNLMKFMGVSISQLNESAVADPRLRKAYKEQLIRQAQSRAVTMKLSQAFAGLSKDAKPLQAVIKGLGESVVREGNKMERALSVASELFGAFSKTIIMEAEAISGPLGIGKKEKIEAGIKSEQMTADAGMEIEQLVRAFQGEQMGETELVPTLEQAGSGGDVITDLMRQVQQGEDPNVVAATLAAINEKGFSKLSEEEKTLIRGIEGVNSKLMGEQALLKQQLEIAKRERLAGILQGIRKNTIMTSDKIGELGGKFDVLSGMDKADPTTILGADSTASSLGPIIDTLQKFAVPDDKGLLSLQAELEASQEVANFGHMIATLTGNTSLLTAKFQDTESAMGAFENILSTKVESGDLGAQEQKVGEALLRTLQSRRELREKAPVGAEGIRDTAFDQTKAIMEAGGFGKGGDAQSLLALSAEIGKGDAAIVGGLGSILGMETDIRDILAGDAGVKNAVVESNRISNENRKAQQETGASEENLRAEISDIMKTAGSDIGKALSLVMKNALITNLAADAPKASGFVPNFAPTGKGDMRGAALSGKPVKRALRTERAMGAKRPVVDYNPLVGTYVRDEATQKNFQQVLSDHPEGMKKAVESSRQIQGVAAEGLVPNFAGLGPVKGSRDARRAQLVAQLANYDEKTRKELGREEAFNRYYKYYDYVDRHNRFLEGDRDAKLSNAEIKEMMTMKVGNLGRTARGFGLGPNNEAQAAQGHGSSQQFGTRQDSQGFSFSLGRQYVEWLVAAKDKLTDFSRGGQLFNLPSEYKNLVKKKEADSKEYLPEPGEWNIGSALWEPVITKHKDFFKPQSLVPFSGASKEYGVDVGLKSGASKTGTRYPILPTLGLSTEQIRKIKELNRIGEWYGGAGGDPDPNTLLSKAPSLFGDYADMAGIYGVRKSKADGATDTFGDHVAKRLKAFHGGITTDGLGLAYPGNPLWMPDFAGQIFGKPGAPSIFAWKDDRIRGYSPWQLDEFISSVARDRGVLGGEASALELRNFTQQTANKKAEFWERNYANIKKTIQNAIHVGPDNRRKIDNDGNPIPLRKMNDKDGESVQEWLMRSFTSPKALQDKDAQTYLRGLSPHFGDTIDSVEGRTEQLEGDAKDEMERKLKTVKEKLGDTRAEQLTRANKQRVELSKIASINEGDWMRNPVLPSLENAAPANKTYALNPHNTERQENPFTPIISDLSKQYKEFQQKIVNTAPEAGDIIQNEAGGTWNVFDPPWPNQEDYDTGMLEKVLGAGKPPWTEGGGWPKGVPAFPSGSIMGQISGYKSTDQLIAEAWDQFKKMKQWSEYLLDLNESDLGQKVDTHEERKEYATSGINFSSGWNPKATTANKKDSAHWPSPDPSLLMTTWPVVDINDGFLNPAFAMHDNAGAFEKASDGQIGFHTSGASVEPFAKTGILGFTVEQGQLVGARQAAGFYRQQYKHADDSVTEWINRSKEYFAGAKGSVRAESNKYAAWTPKMNASEMRDTAGFGGSLPKYLEFLKDFDMHEKFMHVNSNEPTGDVYGSLGEHAEQLLARERTKQLTLLSAELDIDGDQDGHVGKAIKAVKDRYKGIAAADDADAAKLRELFPELNIGVQEKEKKADWFADKGVEKGQAVNIQKEAKKAARENGISARQRHYNVVGKFLTEFPLPGNRKAPAVLPAYREYMNLLAQRHSAKHGTDINIDRQLALAAFAGSITKPAGDPFSFAFAAKEAYGLNNPRRTERPNKRRIWELKTALSALQNHQVWIPLGEAAGDGVTSDFLAMNALTPDQEANAMQLILDLEKDSEKRGPAKTPKGRLARMAEGIQQRAERRADLQAMQEAKRKGDKNAKADYCAKHPNDTAVCGKIKKPLRHQQKSFKGQLNDQMKDWTRGDVNLNNRKGNRRFLEEAMDPDPIKAMWEGRVEDHVKGDAFSLARRGFGQLSPEKKAFETIVAFTKAGQLGSYIDGLGPAAAHQVIERYVRNPKIQTDYVSLGVGPGWDKTKTDVTKNADFQDALGAAVTDDQKDALAQIPPSGYQIGYSDDNSGWNKFKMRDQIAKAMIGDAPLGPDGKVEFMEALRFRDAAEVEREAEDREAAAQNRKLNLDAQRKGLKRKVFDFPGNDPQKSALMSLWGWGKVPGSWANQERVDLLREWWTGDLEKNTGISGLQMGHAPGWGGGGAGPNKGRLVSPSIDSMTERSPYAPIIKGSHKAWTGTRLNPDVHDEVEIFHDDHPLIQKLDMDENWRLSEGERAVGVQGHKEWMNKEALRIDRIKRILSSSDDDQRGDFGTAVVDGLPLADSSLFGFGDSVLSDNLTSMAGSLDLVKELGSWKTEFPQGSLEEAYQKKNVTQPLFEKLLNSYGVTWPTPKQYEEIIDPFSGDVMTDNNSGEAIKREIGAGVGQRDWFKEWQEKGNEVRYAGGKLETVLKGAEIAKAESAIKALGPGGKIHKEMMTFGTGPFFLNKQFEFFGDGGGEFDIDSREQEMSQTKAKIKEALRILELEYGLTGEGDNDLQKFQDIRNRWNYETDLFGPLGETERTGVSKFLQGGARGPFTEATDAEKEQLESIFGGFEGGAGDALLHLDVGRAGASREFEPEASEYIKNQYRNKKVYQKIAELNNKNLFQSETEEWLSDHDNNPDTPKVKKRETWSKYGPMGYAADAESLLMDFERFNTPFSTAYDKINASGERLHASLRAEEQRKAVEKQTIGEALNTLEEHEVWTKWLGAASPSIKGLAGGTPEQRDRRLAKFFKAPETYDPADPQWATGKLTKDPLPYEKFEEQKEMVVTRGQVDGWFRKQMDKPRRGLPNGLKRLIDLGDITIDLKSLSSRMGSERKRKEKIQYAADWALTLAELQRTGTHDISGEQLEGITEGDLKDWHESFPDLLKAYASLKGGGLMGVNSLEERLKRLAATSANSRGLFEWSGAAATGFIPNFSANKEMAAGVAAGYKSPVTRGQVRNINIPGHGKSTYNTQEKVIKSPGLSQPFIVPPRTSKAAKPYAGAVKKRFGFNPYRGARAEGFIPSRFAGGLVPKDGRESLEVEFDPKSLEELRGAANEIMGAAQVFSASAELGTSFEAIKGAAGEMMGAAQVFSAKSEVLNFSPLAGASEKFGAAVQAFTEGINSQEGGVATGGPVDLSPFAQAATLQTQAAEAEQAAAAQLLQAAQSQNIGAKLISAAGSALQESAVALGGVAINLGKEISNLSTNAANSTPGTSTVSLEPGTTVPLDSGDFLDDLINTIKEAVAKGFKAALGSIEPIPVKGTITTDPIQVNAPNLQAKVKSGAEQAVTDAIESSDVKRAMKEAAAEEAARQIRELGQ